jgi:hypothetical protein
MAHFAGLVSYEARVVAPGDCISHPWGLYALSAALAYPVLVASLRYRHIRTLEAKHPYPTPESYASMTDNVAFEMINKMAELEFPVMFEKALQFALFRVWSPSILHSASHARLIT